MADRSKYHPTSFNPAAQRGAALVVSLLMLLVLTVIGISAMGSSTLQERMAGNVRDQDLAFQAAEAALREGERAIASFDPTNATGHFADMGEADDEYPRWDLGANWWGANGVAYTFDGSDALAAPPRYIVEYVATVPVSGIGHQDVLSGSLRADRAFSDPMRNLYVVTARASGGTTATEVVLQSFYRE